MGVGECRSCVGRGGDVVDVFFQAEDGIRGLVRSRGLGDVYKRQGPSPEPPPWFEPVLAGDYFAAGRMPFSGCSPTSTCLLYTSDAADDLLCVDLGGRRIIKKKHHNSSTTTTNHTFP